MWDQFDVIILFRPSKDMFMIIDYFLKNLEDEEPLPSFSFFGNDVGAKEAPG